MLEHVVELGDANAKKLLSATSTSALRSASSCSANVGTRRDLSEDITHHLRAERLLDVEPHVQLPGLLAAGLVGVLPAHYALLVGLATRRRRAPRTALPKLVPVAG